MQFGPLILVFAALLMYLAAFFGAGAGYAKANYNQFAHSVLWTVALLLGFAALAVSAWAGALLTHAAN